MMIEQVQFSERRACRLVGLYPEIATVTRLNLIREHGIWQQRSSTSPMLAGALAAAVSTICCGSEANLEVRKRKKARRPASERVPLQIAQRAKQDWSMDFVSYSPAPGRRIKCRTIAAWRQDYNEVRPHSSVGRISPAHLSALHRRLAGDAKHNPQDQPAELG